MAVKFENSKEAFLAVLSVVVAADQVGSVAERDFLFQQVKPLDIFAGLDRTAFNKLLGSVTGNVFENLPSEGGAITPKGVDELLGEVKKLLTPALQSALLSTAAELCQSDDTSNEESALIAQLRRHLASK